MIAGLLPGDLEGLARAVLHQGVSGELNVGPTFYSCVFLLQDVMEDLFKHECEACHVTTASN